MGYVDTVHFGGGMNPTINGARGENLKRTIRKRVLKGFREVRKHVEITLRKKVYFRSVDATRFQPPPTWKK